MSALIAALARYRPRYEGDEVAVGLALGFAIHAIPIAFIVLKAMGIIPTFEEVEEPLVAKPVVAATLLKLGKPLDPKKLPDRLVPQARTAPKPETVASPDEPTKKKDLPDAAPPPNTQESDIQRLIAKSDPFAEDAGPVREEEGHAAGVDGGMETDPNKVHAGSMYAAQLSKFFHDRHQVPTVISEGQAARLCAHFSINIDATMRIWHVRQNPVRSSGNDLFDDSARAMLQKLLDDRTPLPEPPPEVSEQFRKRTVILTIGGCR